MRSHFALMLPLLFGCASEVTASSVAERLRSCGLMTEGEIGDLPFHAPDECYHACLAEAACDELAGLLCGSSIELAIRCDERCAHRCSDGALIAVDEVCDGLPQCADESDEAGCPRLICDEGRVVLSERSRCDGYAECYDGSDEEGCPEDPCAVYPLPASCSFTCANGATTVPLWARCDGWSYCSDGSDEAGCAQLTPMCAP